MYYGNHHVYIFCFRKSEMLLDFENVKKKKKMNQEKICSTLKNVFWDILRAFLKYRICLKIRRIFF